MDKLVSVIMPAYNAELYIKQSIASVINQTYTNWELLIVNDGSTDNTAKIAGKYEVCDSRVKLINQSNKMLGAARNTGIQHAKGQWIAFLDSDDIWAPGKLEQQLLMAEKHEDVDFIFTGGWVFKNDDLVNLEEYPTLYGKFTARQMYALEYHLNYISINSVLVKTELVNEVGLQETRGAYYGCEDWDYCLRAALNGATFYGLEDKLFFYRRHGNSMSSNSIKMKKAEVAVLIKNYNSHWLTRHQARAGIIYKVNSLIIILMSAGNYSEAKQLAVDISGVVPYLGRMYSMLVAATNKSTIRYFQLVNRVYLKIKRIFRK